MAIARLPDGSLRVASQSTWLAGGILIVFSLLLVGFGGLRTTLTCRRQGPGRIDCTAVRSVLGIELSRVEVRGLKGATLHRFRGRSTNYRVNLETETGSQWLTSQASSNGKSKSAIVEGIQRFVADERAADLTVRDGMGSGLFEVGLLLLALGLWASPLGSPRVTWTFHEGFGRLAVERRRPWGGRTTTYELSRIRGASVRSGSVALQLASGERLQLNCGGGRGGTARAQEVVQRIRELLGLSSDPEPVDPAQAAFQRSVGTFFGRGGADPEEPSTSGRHPDPPRVGAVRYESVFQRLLGVVLFRAPAYRRIADDPEAARSALAILVLVTGVVGFVSGMTSESFPVNGRHLAPGKVHGVAKMTVELGAGIASWWVSSLVGALVARFVFRGRTSVAEMKRVFGYTSVFRLLWLLPHVGFVLSWLLSAAGTVIGVREAAEFDTAKAVVTSAISWAVAFAVRGVLWLLLTSLVVAYASGFP